MIDRKKRSYDVILSLFEETDEHLLALEILLLKLCSNEEESNLCFNHLYKYENHPRCTILIIAILQKRVGLVKMLLKRFRKSIDLEFRGSIKYGTHFRCNVSALSVAVFIDNLNLIRLLIENGADVHTMDNYRATPLHLATDLCRFDIVKYFIEVHADVHRVNIKNEICLNIAGFHGHLQLIEYLLEQPATNINHQNSNADTSLHLAIHNNHIDAVKLLLSYNKVRIDIPNDQSMTPLEIAAVDLKEQIVNYILNIENLIKIQEKIQILELLGASFLCRCEEIFEYDKAYEYLMRAMRLRISNGVIKIPNQLGSAYKNHVECISIDELESIRYKYDDLRLETLVIYDRLLLSKHGLELLHCIRIQASECFENSELDRCIDLCFRGLELSIINNDINVNIRNIDDRMYYISLFMKKIGEIYLKMFSLECFNNSTRNFFEIFHLAIHQFRCIYQKVIGSQYSDAAFATSEYSFLCSVLPLLYVATKIDFTQDEQQRFYELIQWINQFCIHTYYFSPTLLHFCCIKVSSFCPEIIQLLIDCDFDVNAVDSRGDTALHILFQGTSNSNFSIAETIFNLFLNTNRLHPDYINKNGQTALNEAKNPQLIRLYKRKVLLSLKCQCATHLNQMKINYENYLSQNLINFVEKHK